MGATDARHDVTELLVRRNQGDVAARDAVAGQRSDHTLQAERGGGAVTVLLDDAAGSEKKINLDLIDLDAAIKGLASLDPRQAQPVELRFFGGLSIEEAASVVNISPATAKRESTTARVWLRHAMESCAGT